MKGMQAGKRKERKAGKAMGKMMRAAVVDDSVEDAGLIGRYLDKFASEHEIEIEKAVFYASFDFLEEYQGEYDVIFLDIEMPGSNGLDVAREIRLSDEAVGIIFITSMAQYAINGYEVNAIDFMVKPVSYYNFSMKLEKAMRFVQSRSTFDLIVNSKDGIRRFSVTDILYIEKDRDDLVFHTKKEMFRERGSIKTIKEKLEGLPFEECTSGCLINLAYVRRVGKDIVILKGDIELPLSRRQKKKFSQEYISYVGGGL